ncbi:MAG: hypothetical protein HZB51_20625 [Chloroflexi bacterium]|nr:hypothetical protein [Chloroflexota bacterium]
MNRSRKVALVFLLAGALVTLLLMATTNAHGGRSNDTVNSPIVADGPQAIVQGWQQVNTSGFGTAGNNMISALVAFNGQMYATTWNTAGAQVWRTNDGKVWSQFTPSAPFTTTMIYDAQAFGGYLYIGTYLDPSGGEIWRTNGTSWECVASAGLGDSNNVAFSALATFSNTLYVATANPTTGVEIWRSSTGNLGSWTQVNTDGFGGGATWDAITMVGDFQGYHYVGLGRKVGASGSLAELWRSNNGTTWTPVFTDGLGNANNTTVTAFAKTATGLWIGLRNTTTGGQVWRAANGTTFSSITTNGFNNPDNKRPHGILVFEERVFVVFSNWVTGAQVWKSDPTGPWRRIVEGGWGDPNNKNADYFDKAAVHFNGSLYIGTGNDVVGGQIWQMLHPLYLPLVIK